MSKKLTILKDMEVWLEIADILTSIQNGDDAKYHELHGVERAFIEQETDRILTIIALKVFPKYLERMKKDIKESVMLLIDIL